MRLRAAQMHYRDTALPMHIKCICAAEAGFTPVLGKIMRLRSFVQNLSGCVCYSDV